eukprot:gene3410-3683_t
MPGTISWGSLLLFGWGMRWEKPYLVFVCWLYYAQQADGFSAPAALDADSQVAVDSARFPFISRACEMTWSHVPFSGSNATFSSIATGGHEVTGLDWNQQNPAKGGICHGHLK